MCKTILYYTDGSVREPLKSVVLKRLEETGLPLVIERNEVKERSHLQMFKNIARGLERVKTKYVALAEHDCFYPDEHFLFIPPRDDTFYYNTNHRYVVTKRTEYNLPYRNRMAMSGLICNADLLREAVSERIAYLEAGNKIVRSKEKLEFGFSSGRAEGFATEAPYLDIRHGKNFTGLRKGSRRSQVDRYWGEFTRWI